MSHTPGPWWLSDYDWYVRATCNQGVNWRVAEVMEVLPEDEQAEANAYLIAAAPDMLAALEEILPEIECRCQSAFTDRGLHESNSLCHHVKTIKAAIAKAKGEEVDHD